MGEISHTARCSHVFLGAGRFRQHLGSFASGVNRPEVAIRYDVLEIEELYPEETTAGMSMGKRSGRYEQGRAHVNLVRL